MSASLVGSEMCIRDRALPLLRAHPRVLLLQRPRLRLMGRRARPVGIGAVSYTHLTLPTICGV
eukprot:680916-Alexandrium_andersonii.AAC.1